MTFQRFIVVLVIFITTVTITVKADFYPERVYKERSKIKLNSGWTFYSEMRGKSPSSGNPYETGYDDNTWAKVNIPHSASYDAPTKKDEDKTTSGGNCWYRKKFSIPSTARHSGKLFLQFDGAMQTATVWLNGNLIGVHDNSGYTAFKFDITGKTVEGENVLVVKLNNTYNSAIPPGNNGDNGPDYFIFSGLYRNVWLICTDKCYIPLNGQQISVEHNSSAMTSASKAYVKIKTPLRNEYATDKNIVIQYCVSYGDIDKGILVDSSTGTVPAGQTAVFEKIVAFDNPCLWSPTSPYLYRLFTRILADGVIVDDNVDRFGVRWLTWNPNEQFKLNDQNFYIRGTCMHQMYPWIQNAATPSRFYKDIELAKNMGANLIRCSHYPRDPSWYNACDEIGILQFVEIPTWGTGKSEYPDSFWTRLNGCMDEMIEVGYNHPSIMAWGLFNEPWGEFTENITKLNNQAHRLDSTRFTYMANNPPGYNIMNIPDIGGLNYMTVPQVTANPLPTRWVNTEFHPGWTTEWSFRGDEMDKITAVADSYWIDWKNVVADGKECGGMVWCHADYNSPITSNAMGVVDAYRIPKSIYYLFSKNWANISYDNDIPVEGTATKLEIEADTSRITADGCDCAFIYVTVRDASGKCIHTGYESSSKTSVTFSVNGPATLFGNSTVKVNGGKCGILLRSTTTAGPITISATSTGLTGASTEITSITDNYNPNDYPFITPVIARSASSAIENISCIKTGNFLKIRNLSKELNKNDIEILNLKGQQIAVPYTGKGYELSVDTRLLASGSYILYVKYIANGASLLRPFLISR